MKYFLSLGSNIQPERNIPDAINALHREFRVANVSTIYETDPVGPPGQPHFWNLVVAIETENGRPSIIRKIEQIEARLGRQRNRFNKYAPRTIDIDLLPQKNYQTTPFIIIPLAEIAPEEKDRETGKRFEDLATAVKNTDTSLRRAALT